MMRLPGFRYRAPRTVADAAAWLAENPADTMLLAGGTDLLPNMKRRQQTPGTLIGLRAVSELRVIRNGDGLTIGSGVTLSRVLEDPHVRTAYPGLWQAVAQVATPHLRNMGTIGGNLCLDTRCTYYDQNYEWRKAIDFCMKKDGQTCWVATSSPRCLAVSSTDSAPMLQALGASVTLVSARGERVLPVADLFANDGMHYLTRQPDEILTTITLPASDGWRSAYWKLRRRGSFDFPVAAAAVAAGSMVPTSSTSALCSARWRRGLVASERGRGRPARPADHRRGHRRSGPACQRSREADGQHRLRSRVAQGHGSHPGKQRLARDPRRRHARPAAASSHGRNSSFRPQHRRTQISRGLTQMNADCTLLAATDSRRRGGTGAICVNPRESVPNQRFALSGVIIPRRLSSSLGGQLEDQ